MAAAMTESAGDSSLPADHILTMLKDRVLDLVQLSGTRGESQSIQRDNDVLTCLECLRTEGKVCCKRIKSDVEGCMDSAVVYWSVHGSVKGRSGTKTPIVAQRTRSCTMWKSPCSTPKSSDRWGGPFGASSTPSAQFVSPLLKRPGEEEFKMKYGLKHQEDLGTMGAECNNEQDSNTATKRSSCESKDGSLEEDTSTTHSDEVKRDIFMDKEKQGNLQLEKQTITRDLQEKEECLRKLNMVRKYRTKNDLEELQGLIDKWRHVSQEAAGRLLTSHEPRPDMARLLTHLQIDHTMIQYSAEDEDFY